MINLAKRRLVKVRLGFVTQNDRLRIELTMWDFSFIIASLKSPVKVEKTPTKPTVQPEVKRKEKQNKSESTPSKSDNGEKNSKKRKERPQETDSDGVTEQEPKAKKTKTAGTPDAKPKTPKSTPGKGK
jgi:Mg-chelatase subunit ChlI